MEKWKQGTQINLSELPVNKPAKVCFIANQSELLLEHLNEKKNKYRRFDRNKKKVQLRRFTGN
jgi:hypothetical protein